MGIPDSIVINQARALPEHLYKKLEEKLKTDKLIFIDGLIAFASDIDYDVACASISKDSHWCANAECTISRKILYARSYGEYVIKDNNITNRIEKAIPNNAPKYSDILMRNSKIKTVCTELTTCSICGVATTKLVLDVLDGLCWTCVTNTYIACRFCGERRTDVKRVNNQYQSCPECSKEIFTKCTMCGYLNFQEYVDEFGCSQCCKDPVQQYTYKPSPHFYGNKNNNLFYGMELEVEMRPYYTDLKTRVAYRFLKDTQSIAYLKNDATIVCGFEIVTHPGDYQWWHEDNNVLLNSIRKLTKTCESYTTENCGLHIHMSREAFYNNIHIALFTQFIYSNKFFTAFIAERHQRHQAGFAPELDTPSKILAFAKGTYVIDRHTAVNLQNSDTVEIRIFKGNMRKERILKNIEFLDALLRFTSNYNKVKIGETHEQFMQRILPELTVENFKAFVEASNYPNLNEFIKNYKRRT